MANLASIRWTVARISSSSGSDISVDTKPATYPNTPIPVTMRNTSDLIWEYEKRVPAVSETHLQIRHLVEETWKQARTYAQGASQWADETANETRKRVEDLVSKGK